MTATKKRLRLSEACEALGVSHDTLERMLACDTFSVQRDTPRGNRFLMVDEIDLYVEENAKGEGRGAAAVKAHRVRNKRIKR